MTLHINAAFDGGNIRVVGIEEARVDLEIVADHQSDFYQWFYFRVAGAKGRKLTFRILNAGQSAYPFGWPGYKTRASTDLIEWRMIDTRYVDGVLEFDWDGDAGGDLAWFAYFAPYTMEMHAHLVARIAARPGVTHRELGQTLDGQAIDYFRVGSGEKQVWLYGRQHPGESMTEWWMEGALDWLTSEAAQPLRRIRAEAYIDAHLADPRLDSAGVAAGIGASRSSLYAVFADEGGIARFIQKRRLERLRSTIERRQPDLHLVLENVHDPHNVSAVLRTCDAVGVGTVHMVYTYEKLPKIGRTSSASAWKWMDLMVHASIEECYAHLRSLGCRIYATDLSARAESLFRLDMRGPVALGFGNEKRGVSPEASELADGNLLIPMVGLIQSLNISVACAVTLYEAMRQRTEAGMYDRPSLPEAELQAKLRDWVER